MITRSQQSKRQQEPENEYLESKINTTVKRMREFGIRNCCKCGQELEYDNYCTKSNHKGIKYYCVLCSKF
jgi:hypothetical protein